MLRLLLSVLLGVMGVTGGSTGTLRADPGGLDDYGGHFSKKTGGYHYHKPKPSMSRVKRGHLAWQEKGVSGQLKGTVVKIDRSDAFWLKLDYRPSYQEMAALLPKVNRDDRNQMVKVWLQFVSPEASANRGKKYNDWFRKQVVYELGRKMVGKEVTIQFWLSPGPRRIYGMVFHGEENINLWLVLNGWSYYMVNQGKNPHDKKFVEAEAVARKQKAGLWKNP